MESLRISIEVVAGLVPGDAMPEFTKQWHIPSELYYLEGKWKGREKEAEEFIQIAYGHAMEYARSLWNPNRVNWVRIDWIYY